MTDGTVSFTYDSTGQLTAASGGRTEGYSYDALGNRTMTGYQTGANNRLLSDGNFDYTYDLEGNMLTKTEIATGKVTEYTWDYRNRLTNVKVKDSQNAVIRETNYTYDPLDKRIGMTDDPDGDGQGPAVERWTVYDGSNPYADFDGSGNLTNRYLYGPAVDMILARESASGDVAWHLTDHLGSVRDIADPDGAVIDHIVYNSFGRVLSESSPSSGDRFKFTGRELDPNGLYYYRARYYDAALGRFLSEDPIGFDAGDYNLYRYVSNAPSGRADPTGLISSWVVSSNPQSWGNFSIHWGLSLDRAYPYDVVVIQRIEVQAQNLRLVNFTGTGAPNFRSGTVSYYEILGIVPANTAPSGGGTAPPQPAPTPPSQGSGGGASGGGAPTGGGGAPAPPARRAQVNDIWGIRTDGGRLDYTTTRPPPRRTYDIAGEWLWSGEVRAFELTPDLGNALATFRRGQSYGLPIQGVRRSIGITGGDLRTSRNFNWNRWRPLETHTRSVRVHWGDDGRVQFDPPL